ncbi:hypothetical protein NQ315_016848 [Exocentrus adspersus]|uniref:Uncharacterized protein n=1 Tax=Exocentrus adspersus TaxID=1586481 RepID=A0AAV8VX57_9CUCU|nr:hypothetical protein NQ315_016848 [Exocentrus adspersus]
MSDIFIVAPQDLPNICRICLVGADSRYNFMEFKDLYKVLTNIEVKEDDALPKRICDSCKNHLDDINVFIKKCKYSDALLRTVCIGGQSTSQSIVEPVKGENSSFDSAKQDVRKKETHNRTQLKLEFINDQSAAQVVVKPEPVEEEETGSLYEVIYEDDHVQDEESQVLLPELVEVKSSFQSAPIKQEDNSQVPSSDVEFTYCLSCGKIIRYGSQLDHYKVSPKCQPDVSKCHMCDKWFSQKEDLFLHLETHKIRNISRCSMCSEQFTSLGALNDHVKLIHTGDKVFVTYKCPECLKRFTTALKLIDHVQLTHPGVKPFACIVCEKGFSTMLPLRQHIRFHTEPLRFLCAFCGKGFNTKREHTRHLYVKHTKNMNKPKSVEDVPPGIKPFSCTVCGKDFRRRNTLWVHMYSHKEPAYICAYCGESFKMRWQHTRHMYLKHNEDLEKIPQHLRKYTEKRVQLRLKCPICDKVFASRYGYSHHQLIHKGEKNFLCNICGNKVRTNAALQAHMNSHSDEKPFQCENCGKSFKQKAQLSFHMRIHNESYLSCSHCDRKYCTERALYRHLQSHNDDQTIKRPTCKYNEALLQTVSTNESVHFIIEPKMEVTVEEENVQLSESIKQDDNVQELPSNVKFTQCLRCGEFMRHGSAHNHYRLNPECKPDESKCPMCDEPFSEKQELLLHLKTHRKSGFNKCSVCFEQFVSAKHLSDHIRNAHTRDKKRNVYTCPECSQPFTSAESISNHVKEVHPGVKPFQCPVCGKDFLLNKSLRIHMNGHKETTPYICAHCGESFKWRKEHTRHIYRNHNDNLEKIPKHKRKYTEKRVHLKLKCPICEKVFASRYGYSHHQLIHKGEKKFLCYVCGNKFRTNAALQAHLSSHSDQKPFQCENCGRSFKQKAQLTLHLNCHERNGKLNCSHCSKKVLYESCVE